MSRNSHIIFLGLGTNLGDRAANLQAALDLLPPRVTLLAQSPIYQTPPWGYTEQADFLNMVVKAQTGLRPQRLLRYIKKIERKVGRTATFRWGPREIDIDILFYDDLVYHSRRLEIPHPRVHERAFMLVPLANLAPDLRHPLTDQIIRQHLAALDTGEIIPYQSPQGDTHDSQPTA
jgi:2-amino-4-hydroxy-6-hydroxymethyldihydropteridine diphosphokinase